MATATKKAKGEGRKAEETLTNERRREVIGRLYQHLLTIDLWQPLLDCDDEWAAAGLLRERLKDRFNRPACGLALGTVAGEHGIRVTLRQAVPGSNRGVDVELGQIEWQDVAADLISLAALQETSEDPPSRRNTTLPDGIAARDPDVRKAKGERRKAGADGAAPLVVRIALGDIRPSPFQTRREFDAGELQALADSLKEHDLLQPIVLREVSIDDAGHAATPYELIAGERRWRAAKLADWSTIPARVIEATDDHACELVMVENLQRADLNPIEEAEGFQKLLARGKLTQRDLAIGIGRSQPYIANALRLLDLPEPWRGRVISREMSPSHAKLLAPHVGREKLLAVLEKEWQSAVKHQQHTPSLTEFESDIDDAVRRATVALTDNVHNADHLYATVRIDTKAHPELDVIEVKTFNGKEKRAFNTDLAKRLLDEKKAAWRKKHPAKSGGKSADGPAAAKAKADAAARQRRDDLVEWLDCWRSRLVADAIEAGVTEGEWSMLLLWVLNEGSYTAAFDGLAEAVAELVGRGKPAWKVKDPGGVMVKAMIGLFRDCAPGERMRAAVPASEDLDAMCALLSIAPDKWWAERPSGKQRFAGDMTTALWELYDEEQLRELCAEWKIASDVSDRTHLEIQKIIHAQAKPLPLPVEIAELLPGKKKTTKGTKTTKGKR